MFQVGPLSDNEQMLDDAMMQLQQATELLEQVRDDAHLFFDDDGCYRRIEQWLKDRGL